jgi:hypothetical protein
LWLVENKGVHGGIDEGEQTRKRKRESLHHMQPEDLAADHLIRSLV